MTILAALILSLACTSIADIAAKKKIEDQKSATITKEKNDSVKTEEKKN